MKNAFIKSTVILLIGTLITKLLGFFIKIIFTRMIGTGINLYSLIMPTYSLLVAITQLGLPYAISVIMAKNNYRGLKVLASVVPISLFFNILIIALIFIFSPFLATNLLKNENLYYPLISISFVVPFTTISGIIKGYYFGKQNMLPNAVSSIFEQLTRFILMMIFIPFLSNISDVHAVSGYVIISAVCELVQIIVYLFFAPKNIHFSIHDLTFNKKIAYDVFSISIPSVSSRIIGNICYFLEPIILTNMLLFVGYSTNFIESEYAVYNAYVIPILTMPSFFTLALNTTLIPEVSKNYDNKNYVKRRVRQSLFISFLIGAIFCAFVYFKGEFILSLVYNTNKGIDYIHLLSIFFPLFYLEGPLASTLQGLNYSAYTMKVTLVSSIFKTIIMVITCLFSIGIYPLIISEIVSISSVVYLNYSKLRKLNYI